MNKQTFVSRLGCFAGVTLAGWFGIQDTCAQHYPIGVEGIMGASAPPPGMYLKDYNYLYWADNFPQGPPSFHATAYVNALRPLWISKAKFLGADYGMDAIIPFGYQTVNVGGIKDNTWGLGDLCFEPLVLAWHCKSFDFVLADGWWAPSGVFDKTRLANLGNGYWGNMITAGITWFPVEDKSWSVSLLDRYEINLENPETDVTTGHMNSLEVGISYAVAKGVMVGVAGYYQQQTTENHGPFTNDALSQRVAVGPEVSVALPKGFFLSLRYEQEFAVRNRPEGGTGCLTVIKAF